MPVRRGQCPNFGACNLADSREIILIQPGSEFRCPQCNTNLWPAQSKGISPRIIALCVVLLVVLGGATAWLFVGAAHDRGSPPLASEQWAKLSTQVRCALVNGPITFRQGQTQISEEDKTEIRESLSKLEKYPRSRILVEAHVAPSDSAEADQKLSDDRALEVKHFLSMDCGIPESRILTKGYGSNQPPTRSADESDQEWNRRARSVRILLAGE